MAKCEGEHHQGEELKIGSRVFLIKKLSETDNSKVDREVKRLTGLVQSGPGKIPRGRCFVEERCNEAEAEYYEVGDENPESGHCWKCGKDIQGLFKRIS